MNKYQEAIVSIKKNYPDSKYSMLREALDLAIEVLEKATPKKPIEYEDRYYGCPCCDNNLMPKWLKYPTEPMPKSYGFPHCMSCGQALDWSDEDETSI